MGCHPQSCIDFIQMCIWVCGCVCVILYDDIPDCLVWYPERDHISLDYGQKIKFLAFYKQEKLGPYSPEKDLDTGYFDVVGSDRR